MTREKRKEKEIDRFHPTFGKTENTKKIRGIKL
jgi:hypothetical protein